MIKRNGSVESWRDRRDRRVFGLGRLAWAPFILTCLSAGEGVRVGAQVLPGAVRLSEIVATNPGDLRDEDGDFEDWIEIENASTSGLSLAGLYLTDDPENLHKWGFPALALPPGGRIIVFASGKNRTTLGNPLHANFSLRREGEFLAIVDSSSKVIDSFWPMYPPQQPGLSYGLHPLSGELRYFRPPTPEGPNTSPAFSGLLEDPFFTVNGGFHPGPVQVGALHADPAATVRFTIDGSTPTETSPALDSLFSVTRTLAIRCRAFRSGFPPSQVVTQTFLLGEEEAVSSLPVLSIVTSPENLFGELGIVTNSLERGRKWERPGNIEWYSPDDEMGFNAPCGLRIHGRISRTREKQSFRIYFREEHGLQALVFPMFPLSRVDRFKRLVIRGGGVDPDNPFVTDEVGRRLFRDMGHLAPMGRFANLFINGEFQGYYNPTERINERFMQDHLETGNEWDVIRQGSTVDSGDGDAWNELITNASTLDLSDAANFAVIEASLDLVNFVDFLLLQLWSGNWDWPGNNWTATRERAGGSRFRFVLWDIEAGFGNGINNNWKFDPFNPEEEGTLSDLTRGTEIGKLYFGLRSNSAFRSLFTTRFRDQFYGDGGMTDQNLFSRWLESRDDMGRLIPVMRLPMPAPFVPLRSIAFKKHLYDEGLLTPLNDLGPRSDPVVLINEFMASNSRTIADEDGDFEDWIEFYNPREVEVDLSGKYVTDDWNDPRKWRFPAGTIIEPFGFLMVWADGSNANESLHAGFRLSTAGEEIGVFDEDGVTLLDRVRFGRQERDVSMGRPVDGSGLFQALSFSTPGESNGFPPPKVAIGVPWSRSELPVGGGVRDVAAGDVNKDGSIDLVCADHDFGRVAVYLNQGAGTRRFARPLYFGLALGAKSLALADLDQDGDLDVITANDGVIEYTVGALMNDGRGRFSSRSTYPLYSLPQETLEFVHPETVASADFNGDGYPDVAVSNKAPLPIPDFLSVFINDGSGRLGTVSTIPILRFTSLNTGRNLLSADLNNDGSYDLATITDFRPLSLSFNDGAGNFQEAAASPNALARSTAIESGDFDSDGFIDLASVSDIGFLTIFRNKGVNGEFHPPEFLQIETPRNLANLVELDLEGDGDSDLAVVAATRLAGDGPGTYLFVNDGNGSFLPGDVEFGFSPDLGYLAFPLDLESADLDMDGREDLIALDGATGDLVIFYNEISIASSVGNWGRYSETE